MLVCKRMTTAPMRYDLAAALLYSEEGTHDKYHLVIVPRESGDYVVEVWENLDYVPNTHWTVQVIAQGIVDNLDEDDWMWTEAHRRMHLMPEVSTLNLDDPANERAFMRIWYRVCHDVAVELGNEIAKHFDEGGKPYGQVS